MTANQRLYRLVQILLDCLALELIWQFTIRGRILLNPILSAHVSAPEAGFWAPPIAIVMPLWLALSIYLRLDRPPVALRFWSVLAWALENALLASTVAAMATFVSREFGEPVSRLFVPVMIPVSFALFLGARYAAILLVKLAGQRYFRPWRIAIVGDRTGASRLARHLGPARMAPVRGLIVPESAIPDSIVLGAVGFKERRPEPGFVPPASLLHVLGPVSKLAEIINREGLDRVMVLHGALTADEFAAASVTVERMGVAMSCVLDPSTEPVRLALSTHYGVPFLERNPVHFTRRQHVAKRLFDIAASAAALIALGPLLALIAALIKLTSEGPVLYRSSRVGKGGRHFTFLKFRSMRMANGRAAVSHGNVSQGNEKNGHIFKMRNDPRVTPVGKVLRRYSLDELPQMINVLKGEMSIVGPRPLPAGDLEPDGMSRQFSQWSEGRACVPPGLTGLWQVSGRSDLSFDDMVRLDLAYIQNWSLALDLRIIFDTPMLVLRGVGAY